MKRNRGFTLVELIVIIALLAIISTIFAVNMVQTLNKNKERDYEEFLNHIKSAANAYVTIDNSVISGLYDGESSAEITIGTLIDEGYLRYDVENPETGEIVSDDEIIRISLGSENELIFTYPVE